jgi:magnesium transporter
MTDENDIATAAAGEKRQPDALAHLIAEALEAQELDRVRALAEGLRAPDLADVIENLEAPQRVALIQALGNRFDFEALSELDETVRDELSEALPNELLARAVTELETDDAAYLIENLEEADKQEILAQISTSDRAALERNLEYPEETAGRLMQTDFVAVPPFWTVGRVIDHMRDTPDLPETFSDIYVVDPTYRVVGSLDLSRLLRTKRDIPVSQIMSTDGQNVLATEDQEEVARQFERYDLKSAPVVDANNRLVGVVTVDDVVEVIEEEADEDLRRLSGLGDERLTDSVRSIVTSRFLWLVVNLVTAFFTASVIGRFTGAIQHLVALAVLMPIVASMGGNAATQTMTVAVRALATRELSAANLSRFVLRETAVGLLNGLAFAVLVGLAAFFWFGSNELGAVIGAAIVINLLAAAVAGTAIPLSLHRLGFDPAVASTVFVTSVTDVVGFSAFLGLASLLLL